MAVNEPDPDPTVAEQHRLSLERFRQRQLMRPAPVMPRRPEPAPADQRRFGVIPTKSRELREHERRMNQTYWTAEELAFAQVAGVGLAVHGMSVGSAGAAAAERILLRTDPDSITGVIAEDMMQRCAEHIAEVYDSTLSVFSKRVLG